jgi:Flp pilus assembly protein CpaB
MTTTLPGVSANGRGAGTIGRPGTPLPVRQKRPGYAAIAIVLIVGLGALGAYFYSKAGEKTPVVVVTKDVPAGHRITRDDLSTVNVAGGVTAIAGSHLDSVVGQVAAVELLPNTLLQRAMVTSASPLPAGSSMVGVELKPGQLPAAGVTDGAHVQVLQLPNKNTTSASSSPQNATVLATSATVYDSASDPSQTGGTLVTLIVPSDEAAPIAAASSAGLVALVQVGQ